MSIYIRNREGTLSPLKIPAIKGENGVTPNIQVGTVTTLEAGANATVAREGTNENPVFNFGIPKGIDGTGSSNNRASIDDTTMSSEKTWSSSKIEEFTLNNVGAIWEEITGGQAVIDSTMEGFLREVEIWGNTIQNQDNLEDVQHLGVWNEEKQGYEIEICVSSSSNKEDLNYQEFKIVILLPCQLMKIGNMYDRLYWNKNKGRYIIEKNIKTTNLPAIENITNSRIDGDKGCKCDITYYGENFKKWDKAFAGIESIQASVHGKYDLMKIPGLISLTAYINTWLNGKERGRLLSINHINPNTGNAYVNIVFRDTNCTDVEEMNNWVMSFSKKIAYYRLATPEIIDTDIVEELKLPTFINNTYVSVRGGIEGSIKAKAPVDGGKVIGALQEANIELKAINDGQDKLIDTTMLAADEMFMMLEPLLSEAVNLNILNERSGSKMVDMYVAMVQRGIKTIDEVPARYREQVKEILEQLEK